MPSLNSLQASQPWEIPYSNEFDQSKAENPARQISHDLMHVMKAVGRMADQCEKTDHGKGPVDRQIFRDNLPDLVICAMHIANELGIVLEWEVLETMERHHGVKIPEEK